MMRGNEDPPSAVGGLEGIVDGERVCLKVAQSLAEVNAAGVGRVAAVEGEQQI